MINSRLIIIAASAALAGIVAIEVITSEGDPGIDAISAHIECTVNSQLDRDRDNGYLATFANGLQMASPHSVSLVDNHVCWPGGVRARHIVLKSASGKIASLFALSRSQAGLSIPAWTVPQQRRNFFQSSITVASSRLWLVSDLPSTQHAQLAASFDLSRLSLN